MWTCHSRRGPLTSAAHVVCLLATIVWNLVTMAELGSAIVVAFQCRSESPELDLPFVCSDMTGAMISRSSNGWCLRFLVANISCSHQAVAAIKESSSSKACPDGLFRVGVGPVEGGRTGLSAL